MDIREVLARNLRIYRQERGLSQEELAHRAEIDRTYISALERCVYAASIDVVDKLATALNVEPADLLRKAPPVGRQSSGDADEPGLSRERP
jgi:transcriptional regulator with XRE-family HTH domain